MTYVKTYLPTLKTHVVNLKRDAKDLSRDLQRLEVRGKLGSKTLYCYYLLLCLVVKFYRAFSFTCLAPVQIYWNKRKRLHKKRVQLLQDWFGTPSKIGQTIPSQTPLLSKNDQKPIIALFSLMKELFDILTSDF